MKAKIEKGDEFIELEADTPEEMAGKIRAWLEPRGVDITSVFPTFIHDSDWKYEPFHDVFIQTREDKL